MEIEFIKRDERGWAFGAKHLHDDGQHVCSLGEGLSDAELVDGLVRASEPLSREPRDLTPAR